ncbi:MAG: ATP-binding protein [Bacteroidota bacterium]
MEEKLGQEPSDLVKIVLYGPESTGKTTLAKQLAERYNTVWVPEYARDYLQKKWDETQEICTLEDLIPIAEGQMAAENLRAKQANMVLICDTDILVTKVYSEAYFDGYCDPILEENALKNSYDLYFLTGIDVPWVQDDLRDRPNERQLMFNLFKTALEKYRRTFIILEGTQEKRLKKAVMEIDKLLIHD